MKFISYYFFLFFCFFQFIYSKDITLNKLEQYGVSKSMRKAIQGMTSSGLKKDVIQNNLKGHFPNKKEHELNDIIVLSNAIDGKNLPREKDNQKVLNNKIKIAEKRMKNR